MINNTNITKNEKSYFNQLETYFTKCTTGQKFGLGTLAIFVSIISALAVPIFLGIEHYRTTQKQEKTFELQSTLESKVRETSTESARQKYTSFREILPVNKPRSNSDSSESSLSGVSIGDDTSFSDHNEGDSSWDYVHPTRKQS